MIRLQESVVKIWDSSRVCPSNPTDVLCPPEQGRAERDAHGRKGEPGTACAQLFSEADNVGPPEVKQTSQKVAGLVSPVLCSTGLPTQQQELGVDSTVKAEWGVEEVSLHQAVPTGSFKDLDMHPTRKSNLWTQVTETINSPSVLAHKTPTPNKGSMTEGHGYVKRGFTSLPSTGITSWRN